MRVRRLGKCAEVDCIQSPGSRLFDVVFGFLGLAVALPILATASLAILIEDGWPVIYRRQVLGLGGIEFAAFKLRTMRLGADQWLEQELGLLEQYRIHGKLENDPRVTRSGRVLRRLHIDELPQLVNVLAGQMSIVGPRMIHSSELPRFGRFGAVRLSVRPGVTGLWQVAKSTYGYDERVALDQLYICNRSLALDLRIVLFTIPSIFGWRARFALPESKQHGGYS